MPAAAASLRARRCRTRCSQPAACLLPAPPLRRCGAEYDNTPFLKRVEAGMDPDAAWAEARPEVERSVRYGTWLRDTFFTGPDASGRWCHIAEIKCVLRGEGVLWGCLRV